LPQLSNTADTLAWAYYYKGVYASAIDLLQEAVKESPDNPTYHFHLGLAYAKNNDVLHAREQLERALKLNPGESQAGEIRRTLARYAGA
jgi:Flp pilus assembly protein TadD